MNYVANNKDKFLEQLLSQEQALGREGAERRPGRVRLSRRARRVRSKQAELLNLLKLQGVESHASDEGRRDKGRQIRERAVTSSAWTSRIRAWPTCCSTRSTTTSTIRALRRHRLDARAAAQCQNRSRQGRKDPRCADDADQRNDQGHRARPTAAASAAISRQSQRRERDRTAAIPSERLKFSPAEAAFKVGDKSFNAGSYIIKADGNPADVRHALQRTATESRSDGNRGRQSCRKLRRTRSAVPRIAIVHTWINTQNEGWYRIEFDRLGIPYDYISDQNLGKIAEPAREIRRDPVLGRSAAALRTSFAATRSLAKRRRRCPGSNPTVTPNFGNVAGSDRRHSRRLGNSGRREHAGVRRGRRPVYHDRRQRFAADRLRDHDRRIDQDAARQLQARGSVLNTVFADRRSPIAYGYDETLAVYFNQSAAAECRGRRRIRWGRWIWRRCGEGQRTIARQAAAP